MDLHTTKLMISALKKLLKLVKIEKKIQILELDIEYPNKLLNDHDEKPFLVEGMNIRKVEKLVPNFKVKKTYVIRIIKDSRKYLEP